jgi:hypothetical protein
MTLAEQVGIWAMVVMLCTLAAFGVFELTRAVVEWWRK